MKEEYNFTNEEQNKFYYFLEKLKILVYLGKRFQNRFVVNTYISPILN